MTDPRDPRSESEKARADLKANSELGLAPPETPLTEQPSVTPQTFGVTNSRAAVLSGTDQGIEAGGVAPRASDAPGAQSLAEAEQRLTGRDSTSPMIERDPSLPLTDADEEALSRARE